MRPGASSLDGSQPDWRADYVRALLQLKKHDEATAALDELARKTPDHAALTELRQALKDQQP